MNKIYDNSEMLLGNAEDIRNYIMHNVNWDSDEGEVVKLIYDLSQLDNNTIVCINCNNGMGYTIEYWTSKDIVRGEK